MVSGNTTLERYLNKFLPPELAEGALPPRDYIGTLEDFRDSQAAARRLWEEQSKIVYFDKVSKGWTEQELLGDEVMEVAADGMPRRPLPASVPDDRLRMAVEAYMEVKKRGVVLDPILMFRLEQAYSGQYRGRQDALVAATEAAYNAAVAHDSQAHSERMKERDRYQVYVHCGFTYPGTPTFKRGVQYYVSHDMAKALLDWRDRVASGFPNAVDGHIQVGYSAWPCFELENESALRREMATEKYDAFIAAGKIPR